MSRLSIKIHSDFVDRVDKYAKMNSVHFEDYGKFFDEIIDCFHSDEDFNIFRLNLYNYFKSKVKIDFVKSSEDINGNIVEKQGFRLDSPVLSVDNNILGQCLPMYIRKQFFFYDNFYRKLFPKTDLVYHLY